jgi:hypothetical protein
MDKIQIFIVSKFEFARLSGVQCLDIAWPKRPQGGALQRGAPSNSGRSDTAPTYR